MTSVRKLLAMCATWGFLVFSHAEASEVLSRDIAAQPLAQALSEFAAQTGLQLIYVSEIVATQVSKRAPRGLTVPDALQRLLEGTGLRFEFMNDRTIRIFAGSGCALPSGCAGPIPGGAALPAERPSGPPSPDDPLDEVIVIGSRWWLNPTEAVAPVTVLDRRDIERGGQSSIGNVLQALPMTTGSPRNTNVNVPGSWDARDHVGDGGDGSVRVALHDLPTVVLLNGRRLPSSGLGADASVDLNTLPMSFIERVEVLASGASAAYGADAVGGVVNVVTRPNHHGLVLSGSQTITERGDGEIVTGQAAIGFDLLGGTWSLGVDYVNQDGVTMDRRSYSALPLVIVDGNGTVKPVGYNYFPRDGLIDVPEGNAFGFQPGSYTHVPGATGQTAADYRPYVGARDGFNTAPFNYSQTPNERAALWLLSSRPLGETANLFLEGFALHRESALQAAPVVYVTDFWAPAWPGGEPADNYYNPFGVDVPSVARRLVEAGNRRSEHEVDLWRALIGLEGSVARWTWELALADARSDGTTAERGWLESSRLLPATGPSGRDDSGRIVCGSPDPSTGLVPADHIIPDCVPLNVFGGAGSITEEQLAYVMSRPLIKRGTNEQRLAQFVLRGPGGRIGRDVRWVLGADYRREAGSVAQDPEFNPFEILDFERRGAYDVRELFAEVQLPLLHDRPWAREMALNIGVRWSDFSSFDENTSWQAGLRWQLAEELTLRANYAEVFRAPSIVELYAEHSIDEGVWDFDPCGNDPNPKQRANCAANGVPDGAYVQGDETFPVLDGGNPDLEPETGHTFGAGVIYTPVWAQGLSASIDYFQVELRHSIGRRFLFETLFECAEHGTRNACDDIRRFPDGRVSQLSTSYENSGGLEVRGVDLAIGWSATTRFGGVSSSLLATHLDRWDVQPFPEGEVYSYAGNFDAGARPHWRASGHLDWHFGPWMASYAVEYIGSYSETVGAWGIFELDILFDPFIRRVDPVLYHDIETGFEFGSGVSVRAAITNVTDEDPPYLNVAPANTDAATYRMLGRTYFLELRYDFE